MIYPLFARLFVKDYKNTSDESVRTRYGIVSGTIGIVSNLLLGLGKIIAGILSGSISIISDATNNISDSASSIITIVGTKMSSKKADKDHPFGHQRIEFISALLIAIVMLAVGVLLLKESITKIINPIDVKFDYITLIILSLSILIKLWQSLFYRRMGKLVNSLPLKNTSKDSLNDVIATIVVLISIGIKMIFNINLDGWFGAALSIYIIISSVILVIESSSPLIGTIPSDDEIKDYIDEITKYEGILGVHDLMVHSYGPTRVFITAHVEVSSRVSINISHDIIDNIENDFIRNKGIELTLHMDPIDIDDPYTNNLRETIIKKIKEMDKGIEIHDFRIVKGETHTNVIFDAETNNFEINPLDLQEKINDIVIKIDNKLIPKVTIDQGYDTFKEK